MKLVFRYNVWALLLHTKYNLSVIPPFGVVFALYISVNSNDSTLENCQIKHGHSRYVMKLKYAKSCDLDRQLEITFSGNVSSNETQIDRVVWLAPLSCCNHILSIA